MGKIKKYSGLIYRENLWGKFMGEIYGENLWGKFMGKIYGENLWQSQQFEIITTNDPPAPHKFSP